VGNYVLPALKIRRCPSYLPSGLLDLLKMVRGAARLIGMYLLMGQRGVGGTGYWDVSCIISAVLSPDKADEEEEGEEGRTK
jgi:hypothetical protein